MNKTLTMLTRDTHEELIKVCNNSGLPMCVLELILKDIYVEVNKMATTQYEKDSFEYSKVLEAELLEKANVEVVDEKEEVEK